MGSCISSDAAAVVYGISVENGCACHLFKMVGASDMMMMGLQTETALFFYTYACPEGSDMDVSHGFTSTLHHPY
jgi:hypothetical protein